MIHRMYRKLLASAKNAYFNIKKVIKIVEIYLLKSLISMSMSNVML